MARQFREQLEEEVQLEQARRTQAQSQAQQTPPAQPAGGQAPPPSAAAAAGPAEPERPATYSHAHPTDATGASTLAGGEASPTPRADERGT
jgi:hypothetical protein